MSETALSKAIREALILRGFIVERIQSGMLPVRYGNETHWVHCASSGTPDLWCSVAGGGFLEVTVPGKKPSSVQREWHRRAEKHHVRVAVVDSVREALAVVRAWEQAGR